MEIYALNLCIAFPSNFEPVAFDRFVFFVFFVFLVFC